MVKIAPSLISADFSCLKEEVKRVEKGGADLLHFDVMDGHFVPNITYGPLILRALRNKTKLPFDVHLLITNPEQYLDEFINAGANIISVHLETVTHLHRLINYIKEKGVKAGVAINPSTPISTLEEILSDLDLILIMSVNPGFAGQKFIPSTLKKIKDLKGLIQMKALKIEIEVDGGINKETAPAVREAGADILVSASAIFHSQEGVKKIIKELRGER